MTFTSGSRAVHLDSAAGEPLHPAARETLLAALDSGWADPRRLHRSARNARLLLDNAREAVAQGLGVRFDEVTFTPSGTHAVHLGVLGLLAGRTRVSNLLAHSAVEHSSVVHAGQWHARNGGRVQELPVDSDGRVQLALPDEPLGVVALQSANHEVATCQPVAELATLAGDAPLFMDACASAGRLDLPTGWSAAAASAHKWGGPAGVGVLLVRKGARWRAPFPGDDRADERATGFENVPAALAAAAALQAIRAEATELAARQHALIARIREAVAQIPDVEVVGATEDRLPHLVTFSCLFVDGEALVTELDRRGFEVSSGSACTASTLTPSHVLAAMGVLTHGNVRLSLTRATTTADVEAFLAALPEVVASLRAEAGL
ncbi:cysteine desulfurase family protein [Nocardioides sp. Bht2]|uniref:cysteine desulfurase family protein n=1 Tax=Nocardioides sp. Bht2 TaxID=3392297 RepID=UPI0039B6E490